MKKKKFKKIEKKLNPEKGYIEDTHIPKLLRDAQVLPIWEGTSTVMSLDVLRAVQKSSGSVIENLIIAITRMIEVSQDSELGEASINVGKKLNQMVKFVKGRDFKNFSRKRYFSFYSVMNFLQYTCFFEEK